MCQWRTYCMKHCRQQTVSTGARLAACYHELRFGNTGCFVQTNKKTTRVHASNPPAEDMHIRVDKPHPVTWSQHWIPFSCNLSHLGACVLTACQHCNILTHEHNWRIWCLTSGISWKETSGYADIRLLELVGGESAPTPPSFSLQLKRLKGAVCPGLAFL